MDPKVLQEIYNTTGNDVWQFVPSISRDGPHFVICLIWTMPIEYKLASDLTYEVSCFLVLCLFQNFQEWFLWWFYKLHATIFSLKSFQVIFLFWTIMYNFMKMVNLLTIMILTTVRFTGLILTRYFMLCLVNQLKSSIWTRLASIVSKITQTRFQIVSTNIFLKSWDASYRGPHIQIKLYVMARTSSKNSRICLCPFLNHKSKKNWIRPDVLYQIVTKELGISNLQMLGQARTPQRWYFLFFTTANWR